MIYVDLSRLLSKEVNGAGTEHYGYTMNIAAPTSYTNELGKVTKYGYHAAGWKTNEVYVGVATNNFTYSPAGSVGSCGKAVDELGI